VAILKLTDEPQEDEDKGISSRLTPHSFSDIIFGLALSIGALVLTQNQVLTWQDFGWGILLFGFSFLVIALIWLMFSQTISVLQSEAPSVVFLNLALLFCVALEPYLFYMLMNGLTQNLLSFTSIGYALDVGFMFMILATLASLVLKQGNNNPTFLKRFKHMMISESIVGALFLVSAAPVFWVDTQIGHLRFVFWYSSFLVFLVSHIVSHLKS
jgi:uncharacterized membrane protein